ncbi:GTPase family protein [Pectobacterium brasiliense]|uniref:GTPase family protein n=1 Tax=Pectobacterium brasiliense TaxID=180957 RepID=UPI0019691176|nr:GTPase family protein [Pectobacterium brasiliense]MBN3096589.1 GTPase family protein [Pectobacterium brasiliense]MBN3166354.1 GTPase family protein [Pectobacterium brasiliense]
MLNHENLREIQASLSVLSDSLHQRVIDHIEQLIQYEPVIGVMGKTGAGKSSLCNALFQGEVSPVSDNSACTRHALTFRLSSGQRSILFVDLPGVGESDERDRDYAALYQHWLPRVDIVLWLLKADDRALSVDQHIYRTVIGERYRDKILFVLNQVDKLEPSHEWDRESQQPSLKQSGNIYARRVAVRSTFFPTHPVCAVSVKTGWGMATMVETLFQCLPPKASSPLSARLQPNWHSAAIDNRARDDFAQSVGDVLDSVIALPIVPAPLKILIGGLKQTVVSLARSLWSLLF